MSKLLEDSVRRFQTESKESTPITIETPLGDLEFDTNIEVMEEAISTLLMNAWESYGDGADIERPITIATRLVHEEFEGDKYEIRVLVSGLGVEVKFRDHMFEPFTSTKHTVGVGMGLTVARHSMRGLGGNVDLEDRPGGGSVAVLTHPTKPEIQEP
jgi:signal transduction histidine kinase